MKEELTGGANALRRSLDVLRAVGRAPRPLAVAEIAADLGLKKPTVHRLVSALVEEEFLVSESSPQRVRLGPALLELAHKAWSQFDLRGAVGGELDRLAAATGCSARLMTLVGDRLICVEAAHGGERHRALDVGSTATLDDSAPGRALIAFSHEGSRPDTPEVTLTRARYYAVDEEGAQPWRSVAAPVFDERGEPVGAICLTGQAHALPISTLHSYAPDVLEVARRTSRAAGGYPFQISPTTAQSFGREAAVAIQHRCVDLIGDSPLWIGDKLYWIDILGPAIHRADAKGGIDTYPMPDVIGALIDRSDGTLTAAFSDTIAAIDPGTGTVGPRKRVAGIPPGSRFNDGAVDADGRMWLGCFDPTREGAVARLLHVDPEGRIVSQVSGLGLPNGLAWDASGSRCFVLDSARRELREYAYDLTSGEFGEFRVLVDFPKVEARPAGLAISPGGTLWTAIWDGWEVVEIDSDGRILDRIAVPFPRPSGLAVAPGGGSLIVTSARVRLSPAQLAQAPLSGSVVSIDLNK